jgi:Undecaprenyl-phosphate glucose phosphotransferase
MSNLGIARDRPSRAADRNQNPISPGRSNRSAFSSRPDRLRLTLSPEIVVGTTRISDFCLVVVPAITAFGVYHAITMHSVAELERHFLSSLLAATLFVVGLQYIGAYTLNRLSMLRWQLTHSIAMWSAVVCFLLVLAFLAKVFGTYSRAWTLCWIVTAPAFIVIERTILWLAIGRWLTQGYFTRNVVIVGAGEHGQRLIAKICASQNPNIAICGIFDDRKSRIPRSISGCNVLGNTDDLLSFARQSPINEVIITIPFDAGERIKHLVKKLKPLPAELRLSPLAIADQFPFCRISYIGDVPLIDIFDQPIKHWNAVIKWIEDKVFSVALILFFAPLMAVIALLIKLESRGPVFFVQERFGFNNNTIRVMKFRTMYANCTDFSGAERTVYGDPRVTHVGRILRPLSLDELPQLFNVLRGDMSLIGPRPHAIAMKVGDLLYWDAIEEYPQRHRVMPGITGWAQVNGCRGEIDTVEKARTRLMHDLFYIEHWCFWLDLKILALTLPILLKRENAY